MAASTALFDLEVHLGDPSIAGALHLYPLLQVDHAGEDASPGYVPSPSAAGAFEVGEVEGGGSVPDLDVTNHGDQPLLLVEGETLVGGLQNRTLNLTVLLPVGRTTRVPVSCVEAGRWGAQRTSERSQRHSPPRLRARKTESVNRAHRLTGARHSDQGAVWSDVADYATDYKVASPSQALEDVHALAAPRVEAVVELVHPAADQVGVVVAVRGKPIALEVFDHHDTLVAYWDGLLRGYALDALQTDAATADPDRALRFLRRVARVQADQSPGVGLGDEVHLATDAITGTGLCWEGQLRHLAAFRREPALAG